LTFLAFFAIVKSQPLYTPVYTKINILTMIDNTQAYPVRVSVSEAARLFGVDQHTIRRAIKRQELRYIVVQGRYKINFESLVEWSQNRITVKNKMEQKGIGQYVDKWKIKAKKYSPDPSIVQPKQKENKL
jgi:excisionase family DNA binding protein